ISKEKQVNQLLKAVKENDPVYRNAALDLLVPYLDNRTSSRLARTASRADEQVQIDILRYMGAHQQAAALPVIQKALYADSANVRVAAVKAIHQLDNGAAVDELIALL